jgi:hypothetical protein
MASLKDVIEESAARHDPDGKLQKVLDAVAGMQTEFGALALVVDGFGNRLAAIEQFLGAPASGATQEQLDALGKRVTDETTTIQLADAGLTEPAP